MFEKGFLCTSQVVQDFFNQQYEYMSFMNIQIQSNTYINEYYIDTVNICAI